MFSLTCATYSRSEPLKMSGESICYDYDGTAELPINRVDY